MHSRNLLLQIYPLDVQLTHPLLTPITITTHHADDDDDDDNSLQQRLQSYHNETREPYLLQEEFQSHVASFIVSLDQEVNLPYPSLHLS